MGLARIVVEALGVEWRSDAELREGGGEGLGRHGQQGFAVPSHL